MTAENHQHDLFSTQILLRAYFVSSQSLGIVLMTLDCGFLFQGLKAVWVLNEPGVADVSAQKNLAAPSVRGLI